MLMQQTMQTSHLTAAVHQLAQVPPAQLAGGATASSFRLSAFGFRLCGFRLLAVGVRLPASCIFGILAFWSDMRGAPNNRCSDRLEASSRRTSFRATMASSFTCFRRSSVIQVRLLQGLARGVPRWCRSRSTRPRTTFSRRQKLLGILISIILS